MKIVECATAEEFLRVAVEHISSCIRDAAAKGKVTVGLSGGSTPQPVYRAMAADASVAWKNVRFFLLDERFVPADHADSNQRMVRATLLQNAAAGAEFLAPDTAKPLDACMDAYAAHIKDFIPDLLILGMGPDGHVTSLFPPLPAEAFGPSPVIHTTTDRFAVRERISVTLPMLESAKKRVFLITGADKKALIKKMQMDSIDVTMLPAGAFTDDDTEWIVGL